jgi:lipopolysaccharide/colanic/teichoic acid biosynthesis glycosyltransferase
MRKNVQLLVRPAQAGSTADVAKIHAEVIFKAFLTHERGMAERHAHRLSVIAFRLPYDGTRLTAAEHLGQVCAECLRLVDVVGWLDDSTIGVMLPCTPADSAAVVARKVGDKLAARAQALAYDIYTFPLERPEKEPPRPLAWRRPSSSVSAGTAAVDGTVCQTRWPLGPVNLLPLDDLCVAPPPRWKRLTDILLALSALLLLSLLMAGIAILIKSVSPGPLLFRQERVGFRGRRFLLYKFRSMHVNAASHAHQQHLAALMQTNQRLHKLDQRDPRLIPGGKLLRASGLDELPQLFNVLRGDMSLIGPRPCVSYEYEQFHAWHKRRFHVYPGLTGLWQVSGKNETTFQEMMRLDNAYTLHLSFTQDLWILLRTVPVLVGQVRESFTAKEES